MTIKDNMTFIERTYLSLLKNHFADGKEMAFLPGPRQVGKTTLARLFQKNAIYLNWDNEDHQQLIIKGPGKVAEFIGLPKSPVIIFDELHKYPHWKTFLKGFYDTYALNSNFQIIVTGSARLDIYRKGGDSLMGRYFLYRIHPLTISELASPVIPENAIKPPQNIKDEVWQKLINFGGFPQPFLRGNIRFYNRWKRTRLAQVLREDIYDIARVQEIRLFELLATTIAQQAGQLTSYAQIAKKLRTSEDTIKRWLDILESLYYCFSIRPWHNNLGRSLRKTPKYYLWDWAMINDIGTRFENMVASHLLKAVHFWTDTGLGEFELYFLRTKDGREVDFLVAQNGIPWFLVEVKTGDSRLSKNLFYFQEKTKARHAFQVVINAPYTQVDCFQITYPVKVPARTFLSQLV
ncbi:ATP-binding protein [Desulfonauticus submarinus]